MSRMRSSFLPFLASASVLLAACGGNDTAGDMAADSTAVAADAGAMMDAAPMETVMATLNGANERPQPVTTTATGDASLMVYADSIVYAVNASNLMGVTAVHVHRGGPEEAGPPIVTLFTSEDGMDANGSIATGTITRETTLNGETTFDNLRELVRAGGAYVNVHTKANPAGEIRGQTMAGGMM